MRRQHQTWDFLTGVVGSPNQQSKDGGQVVFGVVSNRVTVADGWSEGDAFIVDLRRP